MTDQQVKNNFDMIMKKLNFVKERDELMMKMIQAGASQSQILPILSDQNQANGEVLDDMLNLIIAMMKDRGML